MRDDNEINKLAPMDVLDALIIDTEIPQEIELPKNKYRVYSLDENTAGMVFEMVHAYGYGNTVLAFRLYYASKTAPKGFIKFIATGLFARWAKWVTEIRDRKASYGDKWYEGATINHIAMLKQHMHHDDVYITITQPLRVEAMDKELVSEVAILNYIKTKFHNRAMDHINQKYSGEISDLLLLFPDCPDHYINMSPEFKHLNTETFKFIQYLKEEALKYYMHKELA